MNRLLLSAALALTMPQTAFAADLYHGMTLIDPETETMTHDGYIVVVEGRIAAVGTGKPTDAAGMTPLDMSGTYALPGLIDSHAHVTLGPVEARLVDGQPQIESTDRSDVVAHNARLLLSFGVTTIRNPGAAAAMNRRYDAARADGSLTGPEMLWAGEIIDRAPFAIANLVTLATDERDVETIVEEQAKSGARFVKLYTGLSEAELSKGIAAAHTHGLRAIGHLGDVSWTRAAELGIDAIVHSMPVSPELLPEARREAYRATRRGGMFDFFEWYEAVDLDAPEIATMIAALAERQVHVDATLVAFEPAFFGDRTEVTGRDLTLDHPAMAANWQGGFRFDAGWSAEDYARAQAVWPKVLRFTRMLHDAGVSMTIGTDQANPFIAPGISVAREMALHQRAGIAPWAVLRMATSDAARILGVGDRTGALKPGMEADILFIAADPLPDLMRIADVRGVLSDGVRHEPASLRAGKAGKQNQ